MEAVPKKIRVPELKAKKKRGEKIAALTAYDATMARLLDLAEIDILLVGDSVGMVVLGYETTLPVTLEAMIHHTQAVSRGSRRALVVADMPFLSYQVSDSEAVRNAGRLIQAGAAAVKIEGGHSVVPVTRRLTEVGIPVMGHLGLTPQSVHLMGGFRPQAQTEAAAASLKDDARALEQAGAFAIVLESIPSAVAREVTEMVSIPTIGIGAGPYCDGQVLVSYDAFGLFDAFVVPFAKRYASLGEAMVTAARAFAEDVQTGRFPGLEDAKPASRPRKVQE